MQIVGCSRGEGRDWQPAANFVSQYIQQLFLSLRPSIGKLFLEMVPDAFVGIQFRGIGWKGHKVKAVRTAQKFLNGVAAMDLAVVPQNHQQTWYLVQELAQEQGNLLSLDVALVDVTVQSAVETPRADGNARDGGYAVVTVAMPQDKGLAHGTPGLAHSWD